MTFDGRIEAQFTIPAGGAIVSATNNGGGPTNVTVAAASYYLSTVGIGAGLIDTFETQLNASRAPSAGAWEVSLDTGANGTLRTSITCPGTWSIAWTSTTLRDLLGFTGDLTSVTGTQTGTRQARGVWGPDCPAWLDGDARMAPKVTDLRELVAPTGDAIGLVGNSRYVHTNLRYSHVPTARYREGSVTYAYASWEAFLDDTQFGDGHAWFRPLSKVHVYDHATNRLGSDEGIGGWYMRRVSRLATTRAEENFNGYWRVEIPELTSGG